MIAALTSVMPAGFVVDGGCPIGVRSAGGTVGPDQTCHAHIETELTGASYTPIGLVNADPAGIQVRADAPYKTTAELLAAIKVNPGKFKATGTAYRSGTPASGTQSLVFRIANDTGAANEGRPATSYTAFNYDLGKGAPITFDTLFKPGTKPVDVQHELEKRGVAVLPSFNDFGVHGYQNFAITDDAVIFFFDHDFLHEGPGKVSVPRTELASLLA